VLQNYRHAPPPADATDPERLLSLKGQAATFEYYGLMARIEGRLRRGFRRWHGGDGGNGGGANENFSEAAAEAAAEVPQLQRLPNGHYLSDGLQLLLQWSQLSGEGSSPGS